MDFIMFKLIFPALIIICFCVIFIVIPMGAYQALTAKSCEIYGPEYEAHGFVVVGKVMVPTTYKTRDCKVEGK